MELKVGDWVRVTNITMLSYGECYQVTEVRDNYVRTTHPIVLFSTFCFNEIEKITEEEALLYKLSN